MGVTIADVEKVALLAKLQFSQEEKEKFTAQLNRILEYMEKLNELDTENVEPTSHVVPLKNVFREDKVGESLPQEGVLANAPAQAEGHFLVPKVME